MIGRLEMRLLNYFLLIAFAAILIGVEFYFEMSKTGLSQEMCHVETQPGDRTLSEDSVTPPLSALHGLRNKIVTMFGVLTVVVAIVLMMFIKNITMPLCKMVDVARHINAGDLSQVITLGTNDEISQVGEAINELTSNLQEVAALTSTTTNHVLRNLDEFVETLKNNAPPDLDKIQDIKTSMESLNEFMNAFKLMQTDINTKG